MNIFKKATFTFSAAIFMAGMNTDVMAQTTPPEQHVVHVVTWKTRMPEGGSKAERDSLMLVRHKMTTMKNDKILKFETLYHFMTPDNHDYVEIYEYKNWADVEAAFDVDEDLLKKAIPDQMAREAFENKINSYFSGHGDNIYMKSNVLIK